MPRRIEAGKKYGYFTAIRQVDRKTYLQDGSKKANRGTRMPLWLVRCDCGTISTIVATQLTKRDMPSCGCAVYGNKAGRYSGLLPESTVKSLKLYCMATRSNPSQVIHEAIKEMVDCISEKSSDQKN